MYSKRTGSNIYGVAANDCMSAYLPWQCWRYAGLTVAVEPRRASLETFSRLARVFAEGGVPACNHRRCATPVIVCAWKVATFLSPRALSMYKQLQLRCLALSDAFLVYDVLGTLWGRKYCMMATSIGQNALSLTLSSSVLCNFAFRVSVSVFVPVIFPHTLGGEGGVFLRPPRRLALVFSVSTTARRLLRCPLPPPSWSSPSPASPRHGLDHESALYGQAIVR